MSCDVREVLDLVADKWSLFIVSHLSDGPLRFTELKRSLGVSQRMLTTTLRSLERSGLVIRTVRSVMPAHVDYRLTPLGTGLLAAARPLITWSSGHRADIAAAREDFDRVG